MTDRPVCPICSTEIHPNEPVVFKDGRIVHLRCLLREPKPPAKATVTPRHHRSETSREAVMAPRAL